jgi:hypothetical protein
VVRVLRWAGAQGLPRSSEPTTSLCPGRDNVNSRSGKQHTHLATRTENVAWSQRRPSCVLWPQKFAENLSFRSASVVYLKVIICNPQNPK